MAQAVKNLLVKWETDLIFGWGKSPGKENGNPLQHSSLENSTEEHGGRQWAAVGCSPWGGKKSDTTEKLSHVAVNNVIVSSGQQRDAVIHITCFHPPPNSPAIQAAT